MSKELRSEPIHCIDLVRTKHNLLIVKTLLFENDLSKHFVNVTFSYDNGQTDREINICFCNFNLPSRIVMFHRISTLPIQQILKFYEFQQFLFIIGSLQWNLNTSHIQLLLFNIFSYHVFKGVGPRADYHYYVFDVLHIGGEHMEPGTFKNT